MSRENQNTPPSSTCRCHWRDARLVFLGLCRDATIMIISCDDCHREISDRAAACPHCGAPKEVTPPGAKWRAYVDEKASSDPVTTIQLTGKKIKANWLMGVLLFWGAVIGLFVDAKDAPAWIFFMAMGIVIIIVARVSRWWHHG